MANPNISLLGATYSGVSGVQLPTSGGGTATFPFVEGSQTITQNGTVDVTNLAEVIVNVSGGGGGGGLELLKKESLGHIEYTSTSAGSLSTSISVSGLTGFSLIIVLISRDDVPTGLNRHFATASYVNLTSTTGQAPPFEVETATVNTQRWNLMIGTNGNYITASNVHGIYANSGSISNPGTSNATLTMPLYARYSSSSTRTINGDYTARVYGVKLYNLLGG